MNPPTVRPYNRFPVGLLPQPLGEFVSAGAEAIGCDESFLALPSLSVAGAAIGNSRRLKLKNSWSEPPIIWTAVVGESGSQKSPAFELCLQPIRDRQRKALQVHLKRRQEHDDALLHYERELAAWKRSKSSDDPPEKPTLPIAERLLCDETTIEALAVMLQNQPRGLLLARDELAGWLGDFDRYSSGKGGDAARWLEMFGGRSVCVDRKTGNPKTIYIPRAAVSITGSIQPATLRRCLGQQHFENGLAARLLLAQPPRRAKCWTETDVSHELLLDVADVLDRLLSLEMGVDTTGDAQPILADLSASAKEKWIEFYNQHASQQVELDGDLLAAWAKLEGYAARLTLVIHCVRWAAYDPTLENPAIVDDKSVEAGIELARWFGHETERIYEILHESEESQEHRKLVDWIADHGGSVTARDVSRGLRRYRGSRKAETALAALAVNNLGTYEHRASSAKGGRPTRVFELFQSGDGDETSKTFDK